MTSLHKEISLENDICNHLGQHGWHYAADDNKTYDRAKALFPADVIAWLKEAQPDAWQVVEKNNGAAAESVVLEQVRKQLDARGTLDVIRQGVDLLGLKQPLKMAQFKPSLAMNPELQAKYAANRLRVIRQVHYSQHNENSIDLVLFLNGIPVATAELKTDFTQSVDDAVDQYRFDRHPKPKGQTVAEPLLEFPRGALVHFAVSNSAVMMTTKLLGAATSFLPFNLGNEGGAGNPPNPDGHSTSYLWESVWQRDSWLEVIGRYLVTKRDDKRQIKEIIFPRYHQLDVTRKLVAAALAEGVGSKYLIQHSAGSGKTNSIAWTAHFFAELHDEKQQKLFDSILVVSDRTVLDDQLQEAIFDFQRIRGVVATITNDSGSKSAQLAKALSEGKKIIVCTIQTFPFALEAVQELAATEGKRFAVIADEAHSSQAGAAAANLKTVLSAEELQELAEGGEFSTEDLLAAQMAAKANSKGITYVAFTATPKAKTLELFGRLPNPALPAGAENLPRPFHVYSMRQAIEEGFILDVLKNYTPYRLAFRLANNGQEWTEKEVNRSEAMKGIMRWVALHPYNIAQKVQIVVEHFRENVAPLLDGRAKAMVVVSSRLEAVRWQLAINKYIKERGYKLATLVAFSGDVIDKESGADPFNENSQSLNPNLKGRDIREAFATTEYQVLLVANKFQTGFDQPLLCGMYVDKRLAGIQAVQTLSRLNRAFPNKDTTYVLDFVNDPAEILEAFQTYYETAALEDVTDPQIVFTLKSKLDTSGFYDQFEVDRVVNVSVKPNATQAELSAALSPVADRLLKQYKAAQVRLKIAKDNKNEQDEQAAQDELNVLLMFKRDMGTYIRLYSFLSQIFDYGNTEIEKRSIFYRYLIPLLEFGRERETLDFSKAVLTHHKLKSGKQQPLPLGGDDLPTLKPLTDTGSGQVQEPQKAFLNEIVERVNQLFEGDLTDDDKLVYVNNVLKGKLMESEVLAQQAANNTKEQFANSPDLKNEIMNAIMDAFAAHSTMSKQALDSEKVRDGLKDILLGPAQLYEGLRGRSENRPVL
jgi:type I restriction enzyme R subunit